MSGPLWTFAAELKANRPVKAIADFRSAEKLQPLYHQVAGTGLFEQQRERMAWSHHWLILRMTLADGVGVSIDITTQLKRKTARKRKYTKKKDALIERVAIKLTPPKGKAFPTQQRMPPPPRTGLVLRRAEIRPRAALFVFQTPVMRRVYTRYGWNSMATGVPPLDSAAVATALIHSYKSAARMAKA